MRRRVERVFLFLLLGAIINIAVSWGFSFHDARNFQGFLAAGGSPDKDDVDWWHRFAPDSYAEIPTKKVETRHWGKRRRLLWRNVPYSHVACRFQYGWPCVSFEWSYWRKPQPPEVTMRHAIRLSLEEDYSRYQPVLPMRPHWRGVLVNTMFYGVLVWLLWRTPWMLRSRLRLRRGLCGRCAYPIGAGPSAPSAAR